LFGRKPSSENLIGSATAEQNEANQISTTWKDKKNQ